MQETSRTSLLLGGPGHLIYSFHNSAIVQHAIPLYTIILDSRCRRIDIDKDLMLRLPKDKGKAILEAFSEMEFAQHSRRLKAMYEMRNDHITEPL